jgi:hypothetical protein
MNKHGRKINKIIKYLTDIYNKEDLSSVNQDLFLSKPELDKLLNEYYLTFEKDDDEIKALARKLKMLKKLSFGKYSAGFNLYKNLDRDIINLSKLKGSKDSSIDKINEGYLIIKDGKDPKYNSSKKKPKLSLSEQEHLQYASSIHKHLVKSFGDKLGIKPRINKNKITVKDKRVYNLLKELNFKIEFLKEGCSHEDFINVITGKSKKNIFITIPNTTLHYILKELKKYFYNYSITAVANTNKIYSSKGTILTNKNILNSSPDFPLQKDVIDRVFLKNN